MPLFYFFSSAFLGRPCRSLPWFGYQDSRIATGVLGSRGVSLFTASKYRMRGLMKEGSRKAALFSTPLPQAAP
jgi:hypothetical protein